MRAIAAAEAAVEELTKAVASVAAIDQQLDAARSRAYELQDAFDKAKEIADENLLAPGTYDNDPEMDAARSRLEAAEASYERLASQLM